MNSLFTRRLNLFTWICKKKKNYSHEDRINSSSRIRNRNPPARLTDCEVTSDNAVNDEGDFIHFALLADAEPVNYKEALKLWRTAVNWEESNLGASWLARQEKENGCQMGIQSEVKPWWTSL